MTTKDLKPISQAQANELVVGFSILAFIAGISAFVQAIVPVVGLIKAATASDGEIKDKAGSYKWQSAKSSTTSKVTYDTFTTFN